MSNNTNTAAPKLTAMGRALLAAIGDWHGSFFDGGITHEHSGIWHSNLTDEAAGAPGVAKTPTGVANVIEKLATDGYLTVGEEDEGDKWVELTELGATTALQLAADAKKKSEQGSGELAGGDVVPLVKTTRGSKGTTKGGKRVAQKTGNPKTDAAVIDTKPLRELAEKTVAKKAAAKTTTKKATAAESKPARVPGKFSTKGQHVITNRRSRFSGTVVQLVNVNGEGSTMKPDAAGNTYAKKCVDHDFALYAKTRKEAWDGASDPTQWCPKCKRAAAKKGEPAPVAKTSEPAKKTAAPAAKKATKPATAVSAAKTTTRKR